MFSLLQHTRFSDWTTSSSSAEVSQSPIHSDQAFTRGASFPLPRQHFFHVPLYQFNKLFQIFINNQSQDFNVLIMID